MKIILSPLLFLFLAQLLPAQHDLYLENSHKFKRERLQIGQIVRFQVEGQDEWHEGIYWGAGPERVRISGDSINPNWISKLEIPLSREKVRLRNMMSSNLKKASLTYVLMNAINRPWDQWTKNKGIEVAVSATVLWLLGSLVNRIEGKRYNLRKKWRLSIQRPPEFFVPFKGSQPESGG